MDQGRKVWAPDVKEGFILGEIADFGADTLSVQPLDGGRVIEAPYDAVYPAEDESAKDVEDNCALMYLNEATLLHNLKRRFMKDHIYTYTANILLAINPYHTLDIYTKEIQAKYRGTSLGVESPHVYAIADKAYRDMRNLRLSQGIVVSGESGAGKTESTKHILRYLTDSYGGGGDVADLESRILAANPFLESFGNAKTTRNNNSSRFGKFVELHFNRNALVVGAHIEHYLLEKSRIIEQSDKERNYHVFYRMCKGAPDNMKQSLHLGSVDSFEYLRHGITSDVQFLDDVKDFAVMEKSMNDCGLDGSEKANVFRIAAAVLHMGNIVFDTSGDEGTATVSSDSASTLKGAAAMLGLQEEALRNALCYNILSVGGNEMKKGKTVAEAQFNRNALAKAMYSKLFDWIVQRVNQCFPYDRSENFIGVLDIAGFEYFQVNSFEQFCINYCNEKLQQFFNERVLKDEQELYVKESIKFKEVEYVDNQDCIDLIELAKTGILAILDEQSKLPKATDLMFAEKLHSVHKDHFRLQLPRKSKMAYYKKLRDNEGFIIRHFAGAVCYQTMGFMDKNNDALTWDLDNLMDGSKDAFIKALFAPKEGEERPQKGRMALISLGKKFKVALAELMEKLHSTRSSFIRCIKPNQKMQPKLFSGGEILSQLQCAGMVSVLDLMQGGFPSRTAFQDLYDMYKNSLPPALASLDPRTFAKALFKALGLNEDDFQFGVSKVFFRPGKFAEFDTIMKSDPENLANLVQKVMVWLVRQRWKKVAWACVSCLKFASKIRARAEAAITIQKTVLMYLARHTHKPRYQGIKRLGQLRAQLTTLSEVVEKLEKNKEKFQKVVADVSGELDAVVNQIKTNENMTREDINNRANAVEEKMGKQLEAIKKEQQKQKLQAEAERLKRLAEEKERQRKAREEEEAARKAAEDEARRIKDMEAQAKREAEEEAKRLEALRIQQEKEEADKRLQAKRSEEAKREAEEAARLEQERRDQELAMRLAQDQANPDAALTDETRDAIAKGPAVKRRHLKRQAITHSSKNVEKAHKKHDLSKWKYADLRDTINTSCDIDLLEACREEFHRRLKVYHAWKVKNQQKQKQQAGRAPSQLHQNAASRGAAPAPPAGKKKKNAERPQRYFRIPFVRPDQDKSAGYQKKGWWFAHFDGQWIARQMELHPDKPPVLLVAGRDDMDMCELSLDETGLSRKRGAEILPREFEEEWKKHGGQPYQRAAPKK
jgi:myosin-6